MQIHFTEKALKDLSYWKKIKDKRINKKIVELLKAIEEDYKTGIGQPEFLKHLKVWSRRINLEHRITYEIIDGIILIQGLKGHYN